jgi:hypothetical protein
VDGTGSGICFMVGFGTSGVELLSSVIMYLVYDET